MEILDLILEDPTGQIQETFSAEFPFKVESVSERIYTEGTIYLVEHNQNLVKFISNMIKTFREYLAKITNQDASDYQKYLMTLPDFLFSAGLQDDMNPGAILLEYNYDLKRYSMCAPNELEILECDPESFEESSTYTKLELNEMAKTFGLFIDHQIFAEVAFIDKDGYMPEIDFPDICLTVYDGMFPMGLRANFHLIVLDQFLTILVIFSNNS